MVCEVFVLAPTDLIEEAELRPVTERAGRGSSG